jgi:hypothetical protein
MVVFVGLALHVVTWATHITGAKTYQQMVMDLLGRVCFVVHTHLLLDQLSACYIQFWALSDSCIFCTEMGDHV